MQRPPQTVAIGCHGLEEGFRSGSQIAVQQDFASLAQDTDVHGAGVQVDTAVKHAVSRHRGFPHTGRRL
jgi:hypothetical protein